MENNITEVLARLTKEYTDLEEKYNKLAAFMRDKEKMDKLSALHKELMLVQLCAQSNYLSALKLRMCEISDTIRTRESNEN